MSSNVFVKSGRVLGILKDATTVSTGAWMFKDAPQASYQVVLAGTGAVTATVVVEVSNDGLVAVVTPLATVELTGTNLVCDGFTSDAPWKYVRARITVLTGTGATINVSSCV